MILCRLVVAQGERGESALDWEFGISGCKLVYTEWVNNEVLLCSTGYSVSCDKP